VHCTCGARNDLRKAEAKLSNATASARYYRDKYMNEAPSKGVKETLALGVYVSGNGKTGD